jgi:RNA polymerase sigma-70 factor (ECF subfamily)
MPLENNERRDARERLDAVESALQLLPDKLREVIILKAYGEHSYDDIARILGVRVGTVMSRLFRARRRLTEKLEKGGQD